MLDGRQAQRSPIEGGGGVGLLLADRALHLQLDQAERMARHFQAGGSDYCGTLVGTLSEPHALLAFRATFSVRGAERRAAMAAAPVKV